jgi:hypothetical protein
MARKLFTLAVFLMAGSIGVIGYQIGYFLLRGSWPHVVLQAMWVPLFGPIPDTQWLELGRVWNWVGDLPIAAAGIAAAYTAFLISDTLRQR